MTLLDRHILKEWGTAFALTLTVVVGILVLQNMYDTLPDLIDLKATGGEVLFFYLLSLPVYLPAILPISFLVSILFALGNLHRNSEVVAMRACGLGLGRISRPLWLAGAVLSLLLLYLSASVVPVAVEHSRTYLENLEFAAREKEMEEKDVGLIYNLGFDNRRDGRLWFMNRFSERAWLGLGVNVHTRSPDGRETGRISAREAYYDDVWEEWVFLDGRELFFDPETGDPLRARAFARKAFAEFDEDPGLMLALHKSPKELSLFELKKVTEAVPADENPAVNAYLVRYYSLLAAPFSCLVVVGIGVPFAVSGVRASPMVGISKSIGWFLVFFLLVSVATVLGERRIMPTWLAAWAPNLVMLAVAAHLFRRAR